MPRLLSCSPFQLHVHVCYFAHQHTSIIIAPYILAEYMMLLKTFYSTFNGPQTVKMKGVDWSDQQSRFGLYSLIQILHDNLIKLFLFYDIFLLMFICGLYFLNCCIITQIVQTDNGTAMSNFSYPLFVFISFHTMIFLSKHWNLDSIYYS